MSVIPLSAQAKTFSQRLFNETFYLSNNPDVLTAVSLGLTTAFEHFSTFGHRESRPLLPFFDAQAYLLDNPDVLNATTQPGWVSAWNHFVLFGILEGRSPNGTTGFTGLFDNAKYLAQNADVSQAVSNGDFRNGFEHYLLFGAKEGRTAFDKAGNVIDFPSSLVPGKEFVLTTAIENIVGTDGNDIFRGVVSSGVGTTLQLFDVINGKGGTDSLFLTATGAGMSGVSITGVENFFVRDLSTVPQIHQFANVSGAKQLWLVDATQNTTFNLIQNAVTLGIQNSNKDLTAVFASGAYGTNAKVSVAVKGAGSSGDRAEFNINATGATFTTLDIAALSGSSFLKVNKDTNGTFDFETIVVSGGGVVNVVQGTNAVFDNVVTVNAAGNSGGVTIDLGANTKNLNIIGGAGNDRFILNGAISAFNNNDVIDGGPGKDTLVVSLNDATNLALPSQISNIEVIEVTGVMSAASTINAALFNTKDFTFTFSITQNLTLNGLESGATIGFFGTGSASKTITLNVTGALGNTSDVLNVFAKAGNPTTIGTITANGVETINITSSSVAGENFTIAGLSSAQLQTITVSGKGNVTISSPIPASPLSLVDASAASGQVNINASNSTVATQFFGGSANDTFTGGTKNDIFFGSKGADTITTGAGNDIIVYTDPSQSRASDGIDVITDFNVATDVIQFKGLSTVGTPTYIGAAVFTASGVTQLRMSGSNLEVDLNGDTVVDMTITLSGVNFANFGVTNFQFLP
jgi:Ca2+-binding RTX toxin-like protein